MTGIVMPNSDEAEGLRVLYAEENVRMIQSALRVDKGNPVDTTHEGKILSIHMQSNRPDNLARLFDSLESTADDLNSFEVIVKIDDNSIEMNAFLVREAAMRPFKVKYIATPLLGGFFELWSSMNDILRIADPNVYFFVNFNDEMFFKVKGWDSILKKYVGLFPDHVFRLRTSFFRFRNYIDNWECGFAPETSAITTRKWIEIGGDWNPCLGPDTFQQCVSYYFNYHERFYRDRYIRDIPINDILIGGEGAGVGLRGEALERWFHGAVKSWYKLMSYKVQTEASRRARKLYAYVWAKDHGMKNFSLVDCEKKKVIFLKSANKKIIYKTFPYKLNRLINLYKNVIRLMSYYNYAGGGRDIRVNRMKCFKLMLSYRFSILAKLKMFNQGRTVLMPPVLTKNHIKISIAWPTYSNKIQNYLPREFIKLLRNKLIDSSIGLTEAEAHPGYIVLRFICPIKMSIAELISKAQKVAKTIYKEKNKQDMTTDFVLWVDLLNNKNYCFFSDDKTELAALLSWKKLSSVEVEAELIN
jgi:hypothetical protein